LKSRSGLAEKSMTDDVIDRPARGGT